MLTNEELDQFKRCETTPTHCIMVSVTGEGGGSLQNTFAIIFAQPYSVCMQESMQFWNLETIKILFCKKCLTKKVFNASKLEILGHLLGAGGPDLGKILSLKFCCFLSKLAPKDRTLRVGPGKICLTWPKGGLMVPTWRMRQRNLQMTDEWKFLARVTLNQIYVTSNREQHKCGDLELGM